MKLIPWALPLALLLTTAEAGAQAQIGYQRPYTNPYGTPTFSPYLNLLRRGSNPAINYYGIVRPEVQTFNAIRQIQGDVSATANALAADQQQAAQLTTGHPVQFLNTTHYFMNMTGAGPVPRAGTAQPSLGVGSRPSMGPPQQRRP